MATSNYYEASEIFALILAGGQGSRMGPLTKERAKPALPYGGKYRLIDFVLASLTNSDILDITLATQVNARTINDHLSDLWIPHMGSRASIRSETPTHGSDAEKEYWGTANAAYQVWKGITRRKRGPRPDLVAVAGADHIYKQDFGPFWQFHMKSKSNFTVCATRVPVEVAAGNLGVLIVDEQGKVLGFEEKPENPTPIPGDDKHCLASMGNYIIPAGLGWEILQDDHNDSESGHDFGRDVIPSIVGDLDVYAYTFEDHLAPGEVSSYWVDVGLIENYLEAALGLTKPVPEINIYNDRWSIPTGTKQYDAPYKDVEFEWIAAGGTVRNRGVSYEQTVLHRGITISEYVKLRRTVVFDGVQIGAGADTQNTIIDEHVVIPEGIKIGYDPDEDEANGFHVHPLSDGSHITIVPSWYEFS